MVVTPTKEMMPQLKELWQLGFGDDDSYASFVFDGLLTPDKILVYNDKAGQPLAMLCMEPMELVSGQETTSATYMYAFTVHPRFRGQRIGEQLLDGFHDYCRKKKYYASVLTPADKGLFAYYEKLGYKNQFAVRQLRFDGNFFVTSHRSTILISRAFDSLVGLRAEFFSGSKLMVNWSAPYLKFVGEETKLRGGEVLSVSVGNRRGYLVYRMEENEAIITEFALPHDCMDDALSALHNRINADQYKVRLCADYPSRDGGMVLPFSMIKWYDKMKVDSSVNGAPYINHVMD